MKLDHLVIATRDLATGAAEIEEALGVPLAPGGQHAVMGTHNRLLSLGPIYLEVIAIDPAAPDPGRARWYALDRFEGPTRLTHWAAAADVLSDALAKAPPGAGRPLDVRRGDLAWTMAVTEDGTQPFGGLFPALLQWHPGGHPTDRLPNQGCRLETLTLHHPNPGPLQHALEVLFSPTPLPVRVETGPLGLHALIATPRGTAEFSAATAL